MPAPHLKGMDGLMHKYIKETLKHACLLVGRFRKI